MGFSEHRTSALVQAQLKAFGLKPKVLAGTGVTFVSHRGEIFPCGYLPVEAGNLHRQGFQDIWENSPLFAELRQPELLGGKCGACNFKNLCSGCRARAYGMTGDYLGEEPFCTYEPPRYKPQMNAL